MYENRIYYSLDEMPEMVNEEVADDLLHRIRTRKTKDGCLIWEGTKDQYGAPFFNLYLGNQEYLRIPSIPRFIYQAAYGTLDSKKELVVHLCGNKQCVQLDHLAVMSAKQHRVLQKQIHNNENYFTGGSPSRSKKKTRWCNYYLKNYPQWSNRQIAEKVNFHPNTVARYRRKMYEQN